MTEEREPNTPLTEVERIGNYRRQTGSQSLTPNQTKRIRLKANAASGADNKKGK